MSDEMKSWTPRTDEKADIILKQLGFSGFVMAEFSRQLERELSTEKAKTSAALSIAEDLKAKLDDINDAFRETMDEPCVASEKHCACVPHLKRGVAELNAQLAEANAKRYQVAGELAYASIALDELREWVRQRHPEEPEPSPVGITAPRTPLEKCAVCGVAWVDHLGAQELCAKIQDAYRRREFIEAGNAQLQGQIQDANSRLADYVERVNELTGHGEIGAAP